MDITAFAPVMIIANVFFASYRKTISEAVAALQEYEKVLKVSYEASFKAAFGAIEVDSVDDGRLQDAAKSFRQLSISLFQNSRIVSFRKSALEKMRTFHVSMFVVALLSLGVAYSADFTSKNGILARSILKWTPTGIMVLQVLLAFYTDKIKDYFAKETEVIVDR